MGGYSCLALATFLLLTAGTYCETMQSKMIFSGLPTTTALRLAADSTQVIKQPVPEMTEKTTILN